LADSTMRRLPSSRLTWFGPSPSSMAATFDSGTRRLGQPHDQREAPPTFDDLRDFLAFDEVLQRGQDLRRWHPIAGRRRIVDAHLDLRREHLLLDFQVRETGNTGQPRPQRIGLTAQCVEILAENLDRDLRAHAREHVIDAVRDRLADRDRSGQANEPGADVGGDLPHRTGEF